MMRLKVEKIGQGLHPTEVVVGVKTTSGVQQLYIDNDVLAQDSTVSVGWPVAQDKSGATLLVELPGETANGSWRVWVDREDLQTQER
ncbi:hypothetical protein CI1B_25980 [Bradyrhizobium ivorense]|uniref:Uncharacterized protein n=1 Tax=Bradyrhizobium ivorense TaxID=2511166 RepID=A0A508T576_9BRAD|nr:hypothetical protein [Bradyrhizobium ivorense]VIO69281.1 hypothetical protein CI1B_25980 [Bradyrhizobium ivorense]